MKKILLMFTGGTIASIQTDKGLVPALEGNTILDYIPKVKEMCDVDIIQLFNLDSTNIFSDHWLEIAITIKNKYL